MADFFVTGQRLIEEIEEIVVQRQAPLHELDVSHQAHEIIGEHLDRRHGADAAGIERRGMDVAPFHEAKHLARVTADLQRFAIKFACERIQRRHDIGDRAITVIVRVRRRVFLRFFPDARVGLLHHHLAEIDPDQVILEDVVVEHVLGRFAEIDDPFRQRRRLDAVGHVSAHNRSRSRGYLRRCRRSGW